MVNFFEKIGNFNLYGYKIHKHCIKVSKELPDMKKGFPDILLRTVGAGMISKTKKECVALHFYYSDLLLYYKFLAE